jgi:hypothetical protein
LTIITGRVDTGGSIGIDVSTWSCDGDAIAEVGIRGTLSITIRGANGDDILTICGCEISNVLIGVAGCDNHHTSALIGLINGVLQRWCALAVTGEGQVDDLRGIGISGNSRNLRTRRPGDRCGDIGHQSAAPRQSANGQDP